MDEEDEESFDVSLPDVSLHVLAELLEEREAAFRKTQEQVLTTAMIEPDEGSGLDREGSVKHEAVEDNQETGEEPPDESEQDEPLGEQALCKAVGVDADALSNGHEETDSDASLWAEFSDIDDVWIEDQGTMATVPPETQEAVPLEGQSSSFSTQVISEPPAHYVSPLLHRALSALTSEPSSDEGMRFIPLELLLDMGQDCDIEDLPPRRGTSYLGSLIRRYKHSRSLWVSNIIHPLW